MNAAYLSIADSFGSASATRPLAFVETHCDAPIVPLDHRSLDHAGLLEHQRTRRLGVGDAALQRRIELAPRRALAVEHGLPTSRVQPGVEPLLGHADFLEIVERVPAAPPVEPSAGTLHGVAVGD